MGLSWDDVPGAKRARDRVAGLIKNPKNELSDMLKNPEDVFKDYMGAMYDPMGLYDALTKRPSDPNMPNMPSTPDRGMTVMQILQGQLDVIRKRSGMGTELGGDMVAETNPNTMSASQTLFGGTGLV